MAKGGELDMNKTKMVVGIAVFVFGLAVLAPQAVFAYRGDPKIPGPNYSQDRHEAMEKAFDTNDYTTWKSLMGRKGRVTQVINAQNFPKFAQAHRLAEQGKTEEANKIKADLGLGLRNGKGAGFGMGCTRGNR